MSGPGVAVVRGVAFFPGEFRLEESLERILVLLEEVFRQGRVVDFLLEQVAGQDIRFRGEHRGKGFFGYHIAASVVTQVQDQLADAGGFEVLADAEQGVDRARGEGGVDEVADFLAADFEDRMIDNRILVHLDGTHGDRGPGITRDGIHQGDGATAAIQELLCHLRIIVVVRHRFAVDADDDVPPLQSGLCGRTVLVNDGHDSTDIVLVQSHQHDVAAIGGRDPFHAAFHLFEGVGKLRPAVIVLAVLLVAYAQDFIEGVRLKLLVHP